ncbi:hypothetical protein Tco_0567863 [Tanacetum coccineum]
MELLLQQPATPSSPVKDARKGKGVAVEEPTPTHDKTFKQLEEERLEPKERYSQEVLATAANYSDSAWDIIVAPLPAKSRLIFHNFTRCERIKAKYTLLVELCSSSQLSPELAQEELDKQRAVCNFTRVDVEAPSHGVPHEVEVEAPSQDVSREKVDVPSHSQNIPKADVEVPSNIASKAQQTASSLKIASVLVVYKGLKDWQKWPSKSRVPSTDRGMSRLMVITTDVDDPDECILPPLPLLKRRMYCMSLCPPKMHLEKHLASTCLFLKRAGTDQGVSSMSDSEDSTVTYTEIPSPYEDLSDIGSPGAEGPIFQDPPSTDYVPGPEELEQAPPSPIYVPFVPEPVYSEFLPEDDVLPAKEQPLPVAASPTTESPGYIPESDPEEDSEEDDEEDPKEDPTDYPADRGDDDDADDAEEEEHLVFADPAAVAYSADQDPYLAYRVTARMSIRPQAPAPFLSEEVAERLLALPTPPPSPLSPYSSPLPQIPSPPLPIPSQPPNSPTYVEGSLGS